MELRGLVRELDQKLAPVREQQLAKDLVLIHDKKDRRPWLAMVVFLALVAAATFVAVRPWQSNCGYTADICEIAELDIDALRVTIPQSELIQALPNIDALDPNDELTAGDIFAMEQFADINFEELLSDADIDRLLGTG